MPFDYALANVYQRMVLKFGKPRQIEPAQSGPKVIFFIGPTGVGKTTTIAKVASQFSVDRGKKIVLLTADTYRIAAELFYQLLLDGAEPLHLCVAVHEVVDVQGLPRPDHDRRRQREGIDFLLLLLESSLVHLEELGVDPGNRGVIISAKVDHIEDAAIHRVMLPELFLEAGIFCALACQSCSGEHSALFVIKDAEMHIVRWVKETLEHIVC